MQTYTRKNENDTSNQVIRKWQRAESQQANPITKSKPFAKLITTPQTKQTDLTQKINRLPVSTWLSKAVTTG